jgi:hypothetical protein
MTERKPAPGEWWYVKNCESDTNPVQVVTQVDRKYLVKGSVMNRPHSADRPFRQNHEWLASHNFIRRDESNLLRTLFLIGVAIAITTAAAAVLFMRG